MLGGTSRKGAEAGARQPCSHPEPLYPCLVLSAHSPRRPVGWSQGPWLVTTQLEVGRSPPSLRASIWVRKNAHKLHAQCYLAASVILRHYLWPTVMWAALKTTCQGGSREGTVLKFPTTCLEVLHGDRAKLRRSQNLVANCLEPWGLGSSRSTPRCNNPFDNYQTILCKGERSDYGQADTSGYGGHAEQVPTTPTAKGHLRPATSTTCQETVALFPEGCPRLQELQAKTSCNNCFG